MPKKTYSCSRTGCDKTTDRYPSTVRNEHSVYCSPDCAYEAASALVRGDLNPNFKGAFAAAEAAMAPYREMQKRHKELIDNALGPAIAASRSIAEVSRKLEIPRTTIQRAIDAGTFDTSHMVSAKGRPPLAEKVLVEGTTRRNGTVKKFILDNALLEHVCSECSQGPEWNGKPLTLQLDHINGNAFDNRLENLRFLCPNCHTQTDTYTGKNVKKRKKS